MLDEKDKEILHIIQNHFPRESRPFLTLGKLLNMEEDEVIHRVQRLKKEGYIRRLGGIFNSRALGYYSTLCAIKVPKHKIEYTAEIINTYDSVTHNYIRDHDYNIWFTMSAPSQEAVQTYLEEIQQKTGIQEILSLPAIKLFKINVQFDMRRV